MRPAEALERKREAIRQLVPQFRASNPRVFGSVLHGLDRETFILNFETIWATIEAELPRLMQQVESIIQSGR